MNELIKINYDNDTPTVSARELHEFLEVDTRFNDWFPRMCEYGFSEGQDYCSFLSKLDELNSKQTTIRLQSELLKKLKEKADGRGYSIKDLILFILWKYTDHLPNESRHQATPG